MITRVEAERPENYPRVESRVILHVLVGKGGRACSAKVLRGDPTLAQSAVEAVKKWVWKPALSNQKPVAVWVEVPFDFR